MSPPRGRSMRARMAILLQPDFWIAAAMTLLAGVVRGFAGFGAAIIQAPVFALLYPPAVGVATLAALGTVSSLQLLPGVARESTPRQLAPLIALIGHHRRARYLDKRYGAAFVSGKEILVIRVCPVRQ